MFFRLLPFLLLVSVAQAAPDRQKELQDLHERIRALKQDIEQASEDRSEAADALKTSERGISDVNRSLHRLDARQRDLDGDLKQLASDTRSAETEIAAQREQLSRLLRERYRQGENDSLKLLLSGQDPAVVARNLEYYGYIGRARQDLIHQHQSSLRRLSDLQDRTRKQHQALDRLKTERLSKKKNLEDEKAEHQSLLIKLSAQIRQQRKQVDNLVRDEKRLSRLLERLAKLAAESSKKKSTGLKVNKVADASLAGLDFARLKGRLALPVAGEVLHRFGQKREAGGPAWKGVFIRTGEGSQVRAVGTGKIAFADWLRGFGNLLIIDHGDGFLSLYSNNETLYKQPGEVVKAGDVVASVGATGGQAENGLYFELRHLGKPFDPLSWIKLR